MKKILGIALSFLLLVLTLAGTKSRNTDITELSVSVCCGDHYGCGTILDDRNDALIIVTALHVLEDYVRNEAKDISVSLKGSRDVSATLLCQDSVLDIAFLSIEKKALTQTYDYVLSHGPVTANYPYEGESICFVDANTQDIYSGSIASPRIYSEDFDTDVIYCYCEVTPGMSGTGLFDEDGHYLGILLGGSENAEAVCLEAQKILDSYKIP